MDLGAARDAVAMLREESDRNYLERELDAMQCAAHRVIAFIDTGTVEATRQ